MKVGVLGLQGDVREHCAALERADATPVVVTRSNQLAGVDALVLPGGESTTIGKLLHRFDLLTPLRERVSADMPLYGTCAGLILMARDIEGRDDTPHRLSCLDVTVRRNAYGRQADSFEANLNVAGLEEPFRAVFIRAPQIERVGDEVEVLSEFDGAPVMVRSRHVLASAFHPEMTADERIHRLFVTMVEQG